MYSHTHSCAHMHTCSSPQVAHHKVAHEGAQTGVSIAKSSGHTVKLSASGRMHMDCAGTHIDQPCAACARNNVQVSAPWFSTVRVIGWQPVAAAVDAHADCVSAHMSMHVPLHALARILLARILHISRRTPGHSSTCRYTQDLRSQNCRSLEAHLARSRPSYRRRRHRPTQRLGSLSLLRYVPRPPGITATFILNTVLNRARLRF